MGEGDGGGSPGDRNLPAREAIGRDRRDLLVPRRRLLDICTSIVGAIWMVATRYIIKLAEANESQQRSLVRAGGDGDGDEGAEMTSELGPRAAEKPRV